MKNLLLTIALIFAATSADCCLAQQRRVQNDLTGTVSDDKGILRGVKVENILSKKSTTTDINGNYMLEAALGDLLLFQVDGRKSVWIQVKKEVDIDVVFESAGIVLHCRRSPDRADSALVIIDGIISTLQSFEQIPKELIDSITTLKGAEGAALYGCDGVNGAIIITTTRNSYPPYAEVPDPDFAEFTNKILVFNYKPTLNQHLRTVLPERHQRPDAISYNPTFQSP